MKKIFKKWNRLENGPPGIKNPLEAYNLGWKVSIAKILPTKVILKVNKGKEQYMFTWPKDEVLEK